MFHPAGWKSEGVMRKEKEMRERERERGAGEESKRKIER